MTTWLGADDPAPFSVENATGASPYVLICDHAGRVVPAALGTLGLTPPELTSHIAWDIGAAALARRLAVRLDAVLILQTYSRLVVDCNRPPGSADAIVTRSERTSIPGNGSVSQAEAEARTEAIFHPYHARIRAELDRRQAERRPTVLVSVHSFTPVFDGVARRWHAGVLYQRDPRLGRALLERLREEPGLVVGDNEPYAVGDATDYAIPVHGEQRGIPHVELEIRQDLLADEAGQVRWAERLAVGLLAAARGPYRASPS